MNWEETLQLLWQDRIQREPFYRALFLSQELGGVHKALIYAQKYPSERQAHIAELKVELSDLVAMIRAFCKSIHISYEEVEELGLQRLMTFVTRRLVENK